MFGLFSKKQSKRDSLLECQCFWGLWEYLPGGWAIEADDADHWGSFAGLV